MGLVRTSRLRKDEIGRQGKPRRERERTASLCNGQAPPSGGLYAAPCHLVVVSSQYNSGWN